MVDNLQRPPNPKTAMAIARKKSGQDAAVSLYSMVLRALILSFHDVYSREICVYILFRVRFLSGILRLRRRSKAIWGRSGGRRRHCSFDNRIMAWCNVRGNCIVVGKDLLSNNGTSGFKTRALHKGKVFVNSESVDPRQSD